MKIKKIYSGMTVGLVVGLLSHLLSILCSFMIYEKLEGAEGAGMICFVLYSPTVFFRHSVPILDSIPMWIGHTVLLTIVGGLIGWAMSKFNQKNDKSKE